MTGPLARTTTALGLAVATALVLPAGAASAELAPEAERTAWFNAASGGGLAAPQPTTSDDDLRVARALEPQAFSALLYSGEGLRASLDLTVRAGSAQGTPDVVACPTVDTAWEDGGNQPMDAAPEYDCDASTSYGLLSEDGTTLSFGLDGAFQVEPGTWSIALVPTPGGVAAGPPPAAPLPFTVDLEPPAAGAFVIEQELVAPPPDQPPAVTAPTTTGTGFAPAADLDGPVGSALAETALPAVAAAAPEAAAPVAPAPVLATAPLAVLPASHAGDEDAGRRLLALLALAGGSAAVGYAAGQQRPGPRLIGGRARIGGPAAAGAVAALALGDDRPRGIGRFAKVRDEAPRRLR
ncbi:MAG: hypothetical protein EPN99_07430 [Frankiales bacterium]|nr:MAG: hypothetical protein EPN99_07430 [Frankiales bacterium]